MTTPTFNFPYHVVEDEYPADSVQLQLGNSWVFTSEAISPPQRIFTLSFPGLKYYVNGSGVVDETINPTVNMYALIKFYESVRLNTPFIYPHPVFGNVTCKFKEPLKTPKGKAGGDGVTESFSIKFYELP